MTARGKTLLARWIAAGVLALILWLVFFQPTSKDRKWCRGLRVGVTLGDANPPHSNLDSISGGTWKYVDGVSATFSDDRLVRKKC